MAIIYLLFLIVFVAVKQKGQQEERDCLLIRETLACLPPYSTTLETSHTPRRNSLAPPSLSSFFPRMRLVIGTLRHMEQGHAYLASAASGTYGLKW